mmetsp:Transcript_49049/g.66831  ORF Transcript_49049/g.66831 Transcript_49049/m.66831 type:complete len:89 (-) Transcript_49049:175-441(-)
MAKRGLAEGHGEQKDILVLFKMSYGWVFKVRVSDHCTFFFSCCFSLAEWIERAGLRTSLWSKNTRIGKVQSHQSGLPPMKVCIKSGKG